MTSADDLDMPPFDPSVGRYRRQEAVNPIEKWKQKREEERQAARAETMRRYKQDIEKLSELKRQTFVMNVQAQNQVPMTDKQRAAYERGVQFVPWDKL